MQMQDFIPNKFPGLQKINSMRFEKKQYTYVSYFSRQFSLLFFFFFFPVHFFFSFLFFFFLSLLLLFLFFLFFIYSTGIVLKLDFFRYAREDLFNLGRVLGGRITGIGIVGISQSIVRSRATLIPEWL